jgi:putative flippase GtrA
VTWSGFALFAGAGAVGTAVHYTILLLSVAVFAVPPVAASLLGYGTGAVTNYVLARQVAFRSSAPVLHTAPRFLAVALAGFGINGCLMWALTVRLGMQYLLAQCATTLCILGFNYVCNAVWTFGGARRGR